MGPCIATSRRVYFDYTEPEKHDFNIVEVAHALSRICRYTGHIGDCMDPQWDDVIYTDAQHSVFVSFLLQGTGLELAGLLHDAAEAYTNDLNGPLKSLLPDYKVIEHRIERPLLAQYGLPFPMDPRVKQADLFAQECERLTFRPSPDFVHPHGWGPKQVNAYPLMRIWGIAESKRRFLQRYDQLKKGPL